MQYPVTTDGRSVGQLQELRGEGRGAGPRDGGHPRVGPGLAVPGGLQLAAVQVDADRVWPGAMSAVTSRVHGRYPVTR